VLDRSVRDPGSALRAVRDDILRGLGMSSPADRPLSSRKMRSIYPGPPTLRFRTATVPTLPCEAPTLRFTPAEATGFRSFRASPPVVPENAQHLSGTSHAPVPHGHSANTTLRGPDSPLHSGRGDSCGSSRVSTPCRPGKCAAFIRDLPRSGSARPQCQHHLARPRLSASLRPGRQGFRSSRGDRSCGSGMTGHARSGVVRTSLSDRVNPAGSGRYGVRWRRSSRAPCRRGRGRRSGRTRWP
jgi:hypothetical protein